jgi:hypothetical protein
MELKDKLKQFKDSKVFGVIKDVAPALIDTATDIAADIYPPLEIVNKLVDKAIGVAKEKGDHDQVAQLVESKADYQADYLEHHRLNVQDRIDARSNGDRLLQRVVAYFSLAGFTLFSCVNLYLAFEILQNDLAVNEFIIMTTSNLNGIFTGLLFTLKDFLFGGSADKTN